MIRRKNFAQFTKIIICTSVMISLSGCYLSLGGGGKKRKDDGDNIVVTTGGSAPPPVIINQTTLPSAQPNYQNASPQNNGERTLKPTNR